MKAPKVGQYQRLLCGMGWHRPGRIHGMLDDRELARCRACNNKLIRPLKGRWRIDMNR